MAAARGGGGESCGARVAISSALRATRISTPSSSVWPSSSASSARRSSARSMSGAVRSRAEGGYKNCIHPPSCARKLTGIGGFLGASKVPIASGASAGGAFEGRLPKVPPPAARALPVAPRAIAAQRAALHHRKPNIRLAILHRGQAHAHCSRQAATALVSQARELVLFVG